MSEYTESKLVMMLCALCKRVLRNAVYTSHAKQLASCVVKPCVQNVLMVMIICCKKYFT